MDRPADPAATAGSVAPAGSVIARRLLGAR